MCEVLLYFISYFIFQNADDNLLPLQWLTESGELRFEKCHFVAPVQPHPLSSRVVSQASEVLVPTHLVHLPSSLL